VAAISANNVWAVGSYYDSGNNQLSLILHWNGHLFSQVTGADVPNAGDELLGLAPVPGGGLWAVGDSRSQAGYSALIEKYDGAAWSVVPAAQVSSQSHLNGVTALGPNNVWAVGYYGDLIQRTLVEHWTGSSWNVVSSANQQDSNNTLNSVAAVPGRQALQAVGGITLKWVGDHWIYTSSPNTGVELYTDAIDTVPTARGVQTWIASTWNSGPERGQVEVWNGSRWRFLYPAQPGNESDSPATISVASPSDVWIGGEYQSSSGNHSLLEHWNGSKWTVIGSPPVEQGDFAVITGIKAFSPTDVWVAGFEESDYDLPLLAHWDGHSWRRVTCTAPTVNYVFQAISVDSPSDIWAAGYADVNDKQHILVAHSDGTGCNLTIGTSVPTAEDGATAISARSPSNVWALARRYTGNKGVSFVDHWGGHRFTYNFATSVPGVTELTALALSPSRGFWAVGDEYTNNEDLPLVERFNGFSWRVDHSPALQIPTGSLVGVSIGGGFVWAAGDVNNYFGNNSPLFLKHNGT
jgi:hypothetical protein